MKTRTTLSLVLLVASCAAIAAAVAGPRGKAQPERSPIPRYGVLVYSDLCVNPESGDYGGQRITLQRFAEVDTVIYEFTAGAISWPLIATDINIDPRGKMMFFTVDVQGEGERTISGKFSADGETLTLDGGYCADEQMPMKLARVHDFGAKPKACKACPPPRPGKHKKEAAPEELPPLEKPPAPKWEPAPPSQG